MIPTKAGSEGLGALPLRSLCAEYQALSELCDRLECLKDAGTLGHCITASRFVSCSHKLAEAPEHVQDSQKAPNVVTSEHPLFPPSNLVGRFFSKTHQEGSAPWFGTVRLWTSGPSCLSCVRAMRQLRQIFPGVCLEVAQNSEGGEADGEN